MRVFIGEHTELVSLEKRTIAYNDFNEEIETWTEDREVYAEFFERQGKEGDTDGQIVVVQDIRCKVRYISGLNEADYRINRDGTIYDIISIVREGRRRNQLLMLERVE